MESDAGGLSFTWRHLHKIDGQGRISFPSAWRPKEKDVAPKYMLILWRHNPAVGKYQFIKGLPEPRYRRLQQEIDAKPIGDHGTAALRRRIFGNAVQLQVDGSGRLGLPPEMATAANIKREAMFVGTGGEFEIWDPQAYAESETLDQPLADEASARI